MQVKLVKRCSALKNKGILQIRFIQFFQDKSQDKVFFNCANWEFLPACNGHYFFFGYHVSKSSFLTLTMIFHLLFIEKFFSGRKVERKTFLCCPMCFSRPEESFFSRSSR